MKHVLSVLIVLICITLLYSFLSGKHPQERPPRLPPETYKDVLVVEMPSRGETIHSPVTIRGKARGWYFEGSFPVRILDKSGRVLGSGQAEAQGDWMTSEFVPFAGTISFSATNDAVGTIVFAKDNPSGLPEHDDSFSFPIAFAPAESFSVDGTLTKDNPGQEMGYWYLVYEEPGKPALSVQLRFGQTALPALQVGERVHVSGNKNGDTVTVTTITSLSSAETGVPVVLYYYNASLDQGPGGAQCSSRGLVPVKRVLPKTSTVLKDTINLFLRGELSEEERAQGITTEFPLDDFVLTKAVVQNGTATLTFSDPQNRSSGGSCHARLLWAEIEATAKQFPTVQRVTFLPDTLFQP